MEEILPFLAALAYMAYTVYNNYQKGQAEAKSRNPSQPYEDKQPYEAETTSPFKEWWETEVLPEKSILEPEPVKYQEPKYEQTYHEPKIERPVRKKVKSEIPQTIELYNPEEPAEEVIRGREIHAPHKHKFVASKEEEHVYSDFDFRDAIIKEAILNRPQY